MSRQISWVRKPLEATNTYRCPCCGYKTLFGRGEDEICPVCFWHDDGQDEPDADLVLGGPNYELSLSEARANFQKIGASNARRKAHVRPPTADEI
jgi:hypothetical protein